MTDTMSLDAFRELPTRGQRGAGTGKTAWLRDQALHTPMKIPPEFSGGVAAIWQRQLRSNAKALGLHLAIRQDPDGDGSWVMIEQTVHGADQEIGTEGA
jgi:hypothetical protein